MLSEFKVNPVAFASPQFTLVLLPHGFLHIICAAENAPREPLSPPPSQMCVHGDPQLHPLVLGCSACYLALPSRLSSCHLTDHGDP